MKNSKAKDSAGIVAEMLKQSGLALKEAMLDIFNDVLAPDRHPPQTLKETQLIVLLKKREPKLPANYHSIAIVPILYKPYSRMVCNRLQKVIMPEESVEQAAYRQGFSTADDLLSLTLLVEGHSDFLNLTYGLIWLTSKRLFDTVEHNDL